MSKRLDVWRAVTALVAAALPDWETIGPDGDESRPRRVDTTGRCVVSAGDPGEPDVDLSPLTYWYEQRFTVELTHPRSTSASVEGALDTALAAVGAAIEADRYLGGLCIWLEPTQPETGDLVELEDGMLVARPPRQAGFDIVASYGTPNPLT